MSYKVGWYKKTNLCKKGTEGEKKNVLREKKVAKHNIRNRKLTCQRLKVHIHLKGPYKDFRSQEREKS